MIRAQIASSRSASAAVRFWSGSRLTDGAAGVGGETGRACSGEAGVTGIVSAAPANPARLNRSRRETPLVLSAMPRSIDQSSTDYTDYADGSEPAAEGRHEERGRTDLKDLQRVPTSFKSVLPRSSAAGLQ